MARYKGRTVPRWKSRDRMVNRAKAKMQTIKQVLFKIFKFKDDLTSAEYMKMMALSTIQHHNLFPQVDAELHQEVTFNAFTLKQSTAFVDNGIYNAVLLDVKIPYGLEGKLWLVDTAVPDMPLFKEEYIKSLRIIIDGIPVSPEYVGQLIGSVQNPFEIKFMTKRFTSNHRIQIIASFYQDDNPAGVPFEIRTEIFWWQQRQTTNALQQIVFE